jgi:DNA-binding beta-propeller fold protein YncE
MPLFHTRSHPRLLTLLFATVITPGIMLGLWLILTASGQASKRASANPTATVPYLDKVIQMPRGHAGPLKSQLHPNGRLYFVNTLASIGVIERDRLVKLIDVPFANDATAHLLRDFTIQPRTGLVYVIDRLANVVDVIDGLSVKATLPVSGRSLMFITADPNSGYIYVSNGNGPVEEPLASTITIISGTQVVKELPLGYIPNSQFYNPVEQATYIGYNGRHVGQPDSEPTKDGVLAVIKGTEIVTRTLLGYADNRVINQMALNEHTGEMYFIDRDANLIYRGPDGEFARLRLRAAGYGLLRQVVVDAKRGWAYVGAWKTGQDRILVIAKDQILAELPVAADPLALAVDATHDYVYVASRLANVFTVIRGTEVITAMRHDGIGSSQITVDEARGYIYVCNPDYGGSISIFRVSPGDKRRPANIAENDRNN